ncbi:putative ATPase (AAA+ superfamily) [Leptolyngbya sp. PCC 7375]|nr:putative ATPase (AAA+ superfamily) [Leptolyngbya sp. PCC 7375]
MATARKEDWLERIHKDDSSWTPKAKVSAIAAGEKEITSTQSETYKLLQQSYGDALAADTTGYGVLTAVHANETTSALIIRGITRTLVQPVSSDLSNAKTTASQHAIAFAFEILATLKDAASYGMSPAQYAKLQQDLKKASNGLLNWQQTLANEEWIERPELDELLNRIQTEDASTTILLGPPGSGKSALMAHLGHCLIKQNYPVLAIKADQLTGSIETIQDLQQDLHLDFSPRETIEAVASQQSIVVLVDQLDAISELLDRNSQRLSILLALIQQLSGSKNIHIVATCREFEFKYGSQFSRLAEIDQINLILPDWETVAPILGAEGYKPASMGDSLKQILQSPLHLDIFLNVAQPGDVFTSSQKLLDSFWEKQVRQKPDVERRIALLDKLADRMTRQEVLWIPKVFTDDDPETCQILENDGLLITNLENNTIGFRHQTYYDHTLARSFARGTQSLTDLVLERQDGLFARPILLRGLNYLRGTDSHAYQEVLVNLLQTRKDEIRPHIRSLLIEFVGAQHEPNSVEAELIIPLLDSETEGIKVLDAMIASPGWFKRLYHCLGFTQWLEKPVDKALYCSPLLTAATSFASDEVWTLLEDYWLDNEIYDALSTRVVLDISAWTPTRVYLIQQITQRTDIKWHSVATITERIAEFLPNYAIRIIRAHLEQRLASAIAASQTQPPALPPDADPVERYIHSREYDLEKPLRDLLENERDFYEIEKIAQTMPKEFLNEVWPWFVNVVDQVSLEENWTSTGYRENRFITLDGYCVGDIVQSILAAVLELTQQDNKGFLEFLEHNVQSDLLLIHQLLARGLEKITSQEPQIVLSYLVDDPRRLCIGDSIYGHHFETRKLISAVCPHVSSDDREKLEAAICQFDHCQPHEDSDPETRLNFLKYNRQHRLHLLRAFPEGCLSISGRRLLEQEIRAFPWEIEEDRFPMVTMAQEIGARMTTKEMMSASDHHLLNLFNKFPDGTGSMRTGLRNLSRAGGSAQQSSEFGKLVKDNPARFFRILPHLEPGKHESYIAASLEALAEIDFPAADLIDQIEKLHQQGCKSETFITRAASALGKLAEKNFGLPPSTMSMLESWLSLHSHPTLEQYQSKENRKPTSSIVFGYGSSHTLPGGRGDIVRTLASGYLRRNPPDLEGWFKFIQSQIDIEKHPAIWVDIVSHMPCLLNGEPYQATALFDTVIQKYPEVLHYRWALFRISRTVGWFQPKETVQGWLETLKSQNSEFSKQAYGEILLIYCFQHSDEWSIKQIHSYLNAQDDESILCGLAHAASHLWKHRKCRKISAEILYNLASSPYVSVQKAVANFFHWNRDHFRLNADTRRIILSVCKTREVLLDSANDLIEIIETEDLVDSNPELVAEVCRRLIGLGQELTNPARITIWIAESLTTLAIQLHRQHPYREIGLQIFEQLLTLNLRETKSALETLDRRPGQVVPYKPPRRKRLRKRN